VDIPAAYARAEIEVKRSRFIAEVFPADSQAEARELLKSQKARYADASHVVHAFIAGHQGEVRGMSDDGEPAGTAARPMMDILTGKKCTNMLLTVTRYFGGTLLGTGGLVKAYGDAAKAALSVCGFKPLAAKCAFSVSVPYHVYQKTEGLLRSLGAEEIQRVFETGVHITGLIPEAAWAALQAEITDLTGGKSGVLP
jgi:uncharacterized YigZ family protein